MSGGRRQGFDYDGQTTATLQVDTKAAFGLSGGLFNVSGLQIHGRSISADTKKPSVSVRRGKYSSAVMMLWNSA